MLDIRALAYVAPLAEVPFESVPLTVRIANVADETGLVTGVFRIYNDNTGTLIHTSEIVPISLAAGASADVSALTDFDPPAIADDTYFVIFDGNASNALVPDGIVIHLGAFHFDVKAAGMGPAPATHHLTHEEGGSDEIEVTDMGTAELDDTLVLHPDGAGGVEWEAGGGGLHAATHENGGADVIDGQINPSSVRTSTIKPPADSADAMDFTKADGTTPIASIDSTNKNVGIGTTAPAHRLHIKDNASAASWIFGVHADDQNPWIAGFFNDTFDSTTPVFEYYCANDGSFAMGTHGGHTLTLYTNGFANPRLIIDSAGNVGIGNITPTTKLDVDGDKLRLRTAKTPANAGAAGNAGDICWDADYIYVCVATNTWVRVETQTW